MAHGKMTSSGGRLFILQAQPPAIIALDPDSGRSETVLVPPSGIPDGIQVDGSGNAIYWTSMGIKPSNGEEFLEADGAIERCDLDGQNHAILVGHGQIVTPKQLQFDRRDGLLYWCDREGMAVARCSKDGGGLTTLLRTGQWPDDVADVLRHCVGIAVDAANRMLYWTQKGPADAGLGRIFRMGLTIPDGTSPETRADVELLIDHLPEPIDLEIDHERGQLYWSDRGDLSGGNSVNRADITPDGLANHEVLATGLQEGIGIALDLGRRHIFVGDLSGAIRMLPLDGGDMATIHRCAGPVTGIAFLPAFERDQAP
ncbi:3-hydroxyacyl-CoA dehydrogenase [Labrys sp. KB_33_2]|uniref:3-hydroxyacyl-CoA dehydrogenase n=1 Tax=Labrys sp. KB_33_2 TaxID=3237479 RepID=UPI003F91EA96